MKLPLVSSAKILKYLSKQGFNIVRQKGSHISLHKVKSGKKLLVVVPKKNLIKRPTLASILKQADISREEFLEDFK